MDNLTKGKKAKSSTRRKDGDLEILPADPALERTIDNIVKMLTRDLDFEKAFLEIMINKAITEWNRTHEKKISKSTAESNEEFWIFFQHYYEDLGTDTDDTTAGETEPKQATITREVAKKTPFEEVAEEVIEYIKHEPLAKAKVQCYLNDKATNGLVSKPLTKKEKNDGTVFYSQKTNQAAKGNTPVVTTVSLSFEDDSITYTRALNWFDMPVYNTVASIFHEESFNGKSEITFTPQEVWRRMNGITDSRKNPTKQQLYEIRQSINKMRHTDVEIDFKEELKAPHMLNDKIPKGAKPFIKDYMLNITEVGLKVGNSAEVYGYRLNKAPILYTYNRMKAGNRIVYCDYSLLNTSEKTGNEGYTVAFKDYILKQIHLMYGKGRSNTNILFLTIYSETGVPEPAARVERSNYKDDKTYNSNIRKEAAKDRKKIFDLLEAWVDADFIKGYKPTKKGRLITGVEVILNQRKK